MRALAALMLLIMLGLGGTIAQPRDAYAVGTIQVPTPASSCAEDDPCWDCSTMGNRICGPHYVGIYVGRVVGALHRTDAIGGDLWWCLVEPKVKSPYCG